MVDDHPVNRLVAVAQLTQLGYAADAAEDGEMALDALAQEPYDAVLLDCEMPRLDGYETCRRLRQREGGGRRTWVIALTAHTKAEDRERCRAAGMDDHLAKPVRTEDLAAALKRRLEGAGDPGPERFPRSNPTASKSAWRPSRASARRPGKICWSRWSRASSSKARGTSRPCGGAWPAAMAAPLPRPPTPWPGAPASSGRPGSPRASAELEELARQGDLAACEPRLESVEQAYQAIARRLAA